ncbi:hypothetical protein D3C87_1857470 [compost metagenome]
MALISSKKAAPFSFAIRAARSAFIARPASRAFCSFREVAKRLKAPSPAMAYSEPSSFATRSLPATLPIAPAADSTPTAAPLAEVPAPELSTRLPMSKAARPRASAYLPSSMARE